MHQAMENWVEEKRAAFLYEAIALKTHNLTHKKLFTELARVANKQAKLWELELLRLELQTTFEYRPSLRTRLVKKLLGWLGPEMIRPILVAMKVRGMSIYQDLSAPEPTLAPDSHTAFEKQHRLIQAGGNLRASVFGINDGLVSNMSLILGVAGASNHTPYILLSGIAGLLAGASSMAAGEYISVRSQRELYEHQMELERQEFALYPEEEAYELALIYRARGFSEAQAKEAGQLILTHPEKALETLAREELGINPHDLGSPIGAALSSFFSFALGALVPLLPFLFSNYQGNMILSIILTGGTLFGVGALLSLYTNKNAWISGLRMLGLGTLAGTLTYIIGNLLGIALH